VFGLPIENVYSPSSTKIRNLNIVTPEASNLFNSTQGLKIVNMGAKFITENSFKFVKDCCYRINYESINLIFPYVREKVIETNDSSLFDSLTKE